MKTRIVRVNAAYLRAIAKNRLMHERCVPSRIERPSNDVSIDEGYSPFSSLGIGRPYGLYGERITRFEITDGTHKPNWYKTKRGHMTWHHPQGGSAYIKVEIDYERRALRHPFDNVIKSNARRRSVQVALFEST